MTRGFPIHSLQISCEPSGVIWGLTLLVDACNPKRFNGQARKLLPHISSFISQATCFILLPESLDVNMMHHPDTRTILTSPAAHFGLIFSVLTILYGLGMGIVFGLNEDLIKSRLAASATEVRDSIYKGDDAAAKPVLEKSWNYMQRAHLHAGAMGTTAVVLIVLVCMLGAPRLVTFAIGAALGIGGLGYSTFWMWAGFRAPALGSTSAAKESLAWLAMPSSGIYVLATVAVLIVLIRAALSNPRPAAT